MKSKVLSKSVLLSTRADRCLPVESDFVKAGAGGEGKVNPNG